MKAAAETLLRHPGIWRGDSLAATNRPGIPTGHAALDALLPGGGWPRGALTELVVAEEGGGEFSLLLPALAALSREDERWLALITPPYLPYAPALAAAGVRLSRLLVVRVASSADTFWAMEQALRSGACSAVLAWPSGMAEKVQRRLQLAAEAGASWGVWFTPARQAASASIAALRLRLAPVDDGIEIRILKRRGGGEVPPLVLENRPVQAVPAGLDQAWRDPAQAGLAAA